jgi:hypothetical protein
MIYIRVNYEMEVSLQSAVELIVSSVTLNTCICPCTVLYVLTAETSICQVVELRRRSASESVLILSWK